MKKIILFLLIALIVIQSSALATETVAVKNSFDYKTLKVLLALDVIPVTVGNGDFNSDLKVTRGEFAYYTVYFMGLGEISNSEAVSFSDVPQSHPYSKYINIATQSGILSGYEDGTFKPDDVVLYEQCIKVLVNALGYNFQATQKGGYPYGYLAQASNISLTNKANLALGTTINQGNVMQLFYNALTIDILSQTGFGDDAKYDVMKGETIIKQTRDIIKINGIVTNNGITGLSGDTQVILGEIMIDDIVYKQANTNASNLLGYNVVAFYKDDKVAGEKILLYIATNDNKNDEFIIKADDIVSYQNHKYTYYNERNDMDEISIDPSIDVIFNGKSLVSNYDNSNYNASNFTPVIGQIKLLDSNLDGEYEALFITSYTTLVVDSVDFSRDCIMSKESIARNITLDDNIKYNIVDEMGNAVGLDAIEEWNVLSVAKSLDSEYYNIILSKEQIDGKITGKSDAANSSDSEKVWIDGVAYYVSKDYIGNSSKIEIGAEGYFYMDTFGKISLFDGQSQGEFKYGYLKEIYFDIKGLTKCVQLKILNVDNSFIKVSTASIIYADSETTKSTPEHINSLLSPMQPIKYSLNKDNEMNKILTVAGGSIRMLRSSSGEKYWTSSSTFESKMPVSSDAIVVNTPKPNVDTADEKDYAIKKRGALLNGVKYEYEAYSSDLESDEADFVVTLNSTTLAPVEQGLALVTKVSKAVSEDGDDVQKISLIYMGTEVEKYSIESDTFDKAVAENDSSKKYKLEKGDTIRFSSNLKGDIVTAILIFKNSTSTFMGNFRGGMDSQHRTIYGSVYNKTADLIKICRDISDFGGGFDILTQNIEYYAYKKFQIYVCDNSISGRVYLGSYSDINDYLHSGTAFSRVLVQTKNGNPDTLVVYR